MKKKLSLKDITNAQRTIEHGNNVISYLKKTHRQNHNSPEAIELSYDLQAGSYIKFKLENPVLVGKYINEISEIIECHTKPFNTILDIGTGELTTLTGILRNLTNKPKEIYAFDTSWSRLYKGLNYLKYEALFDLNSLNIFCADAREIPLHDKQINVSITNHSLEPNGKDLRKIIKEIFRVTKDKVLFFEPSYEMNSLEGKLRMEKHGYIKNLEDVVKKMGGQLLDVIEIKNSTNKLNPTFCYIVIPPTAKHKNSIAQQDYIEQFFTVPGTDIPLEYFEQSYFSIEYGLYYPTIKSIPILKSKSAILASALRDDIQY